MTNSPWVPSKVYLELQFLYASKVKSVVHIISRDVLFNLNLSLAF